MAKPVCALIVEAPPERCAWRGIGHNLIERETFVIDRDHKIVAAFSSKAEHLSPDVHVMKSLDVGSVSLASSSTDLARHVVRYLFVAGGLALRKNL